MVSFADIEARIDEIAVADAEPTDPISTYRSLAGELLALGETVLERWIVARGVAPTTDVREGFRLLALHRQGAKGDPSFNACRETCRELVYHYNLLTLEPEHPDTTRRLRLAALVAKHLCLFVSGKMQVEGLGEFCCAAEPIRANDEMEIAIETSPKGRGAVKLVHVRPAER